ncbi:MAG: hypothetical protein ACJ75B_12415 [Flavisolibacter sp.]
MKPLPRILRGETGGNPYCSYQSVFYLPLGNNNYQVVPEPKTETPKANTGNTNSFNEGYEKFVLDGKTYYKKGSKYFKAKVSDDGEVVYEEVGETSK